VFVAGDYQSAAGRPKKDSFPFAANERPIASLKTQMILNLGRS
jgi:hypothetical protein